MPTLMPDGQHMAAKKRGQLSPCSSLKPPQLCRLITWQCHHDTTDDELSLKHRHKPMVFCIIRMAVWPLLELWQFVWPLWVTGRYDYQGLWIILGMGPKRLDYALNRLSNNNYSALATLTYFTMNISLMIKYRKYGPSNVQRYICRND